MWQTIKRFLIEMMPGVVKIVVLASVLGFLFNAMNANGLPLVRKPLRETRHFAMRSSLIQPAPKKLPEIKAQPSYKIKPRPEIISQNVILQKKPYKVAVRPKTTVKTKTVADKHVKGTQKAVQALFTNLDDAKTLFDSRYAIFVDARPKEDFEAERITGAISLFVDDANSLYERTLGKIPKDTTIVTYCSDPECVDATKLADILVAKGHKRVVILLDGLPGWKDAGYPTEIGTSSR